MTTRRTSAMGLGLVAVLALAACSSGANDGPDTDSSTMDAVTVATCSGEQTFDHVPASVVTIGTTAVRNLDSAGAGDVIVARSGEFGASLGTPATDAEYAEVPIIDPSDPTLEALAGTGAELIIGYGLYNTSDDALAEVGMSLLQNLGDCGHSAEGDDAGAEGIDIVFAEIERLATIFHTEDVATPTLDELTHRLEHLESHRPEDRATAALLYYFGGALGSHGQGNISNDILDRAGFDNVFADQPGMYIDPTIESILGADPEWLIVIYGVEGETYDEALAQLMAEPGVADMTAVQNGQIIGIPTELLAPTVDAVDGVQVLIEARVGELDH